jgi:hypothetical protein
MKLKATTRGGFPYLPITEVIKDETKREAVFGKGHIWRELLWIKLHEFISCNYNANATKFLEEIANAYGEAPHKEAMNFLQSLEGNGLLTMAEDKTMRTQYGDWIVDKRIRRIESCVNAAKQKWKVNPKARPKKNAATKAEIKTSEELEILEIADADTSTDTSIVKAEVFELKALIESTKNKKKKAVGLDKAQEFYRANIKDEVLCEALCEHLEVRQAKRVPNTIGALTRLVKRLNDLSLYDPMVATAIVDKSIRSGWADVFELKEVKQKTSYNDIYEQLKHKYSVSN